MAQEAEGGKRSDSPGRNTAPFVNAFVRNAWYVAALSDEVGRTALSRLILGEPVLLYRRQDGAPVAVSDICPHRFARLSKGWIEGDNVRCPYHGAMFAPDGSCVEVPSQEMIPPGCEIKSYPIVEKSQWIWIWTGDPALADPDLIPDHERLGVEREGYYAMQLPHRIVRGHYNLINENLMDDTHVAFVHMKQFETGSRAHLAPKVDTVGPWIITRTFDESEPLSQHFRMQFNVPYMSAPRAAQNNYHPPATHAVWLDVHNPDDVEAEPTRIILAFCNTPETERTTHIFGVHCRNFRQGDPDWNGYIREAYVAVQDQDQGVIEDQQELRDLNCTFPQEVNFRPDATGMFTRRRMNKVVAEEAEYFAKEASR